MINPYWKLYCAIHKIPNTERDFMTININGYLRLYCKIHDLPMIPKRCRDCGNELDGKYKARHNGYLCLKCLRERRVAKIRTRWLYLQ